MKPTIPEVLPRFAAYYAQHPAWGDLHIVLDDGNVQDTHIAWCIRETHDPEAKALGEILLQMTKTQRLKLPHVVTQKFGH